MKMIHVSSLLKITFVLVIMLFSPVTGNKQLLTDKTSVTDTITVNTQSVASSLRIGVLNSSATNTNFWTGGVSNNYQNFTDGLRNDGFNASVIDNEGLMNGSLSNYDVILLPDNAPNATAAQPLKDWWMAGGHLFVIDSAISYLMGFELLGHEFNTTTYGTSGQDDYWDYNTMNVGYVGDTTHPVMAGYTYNQTISGIDGNAQFNRTKMLNSSIAPFYHPLVAGEYVPGGGALLLTSFSDPLQPGVGGDDLVSAIDLPHRGKIVYSWDFSSYAGNNNSRLLNNSMQWFSMPEEIPHVPNGTPLPQNVQYTQGTTVGIKFTLLDNDPTYYTLNITKDGVPFYSHSDNWANNTEVIQSVTLNDVGVYGVNFTAYDLHGNFFNHYFEVTVVAPPPSSTTTSSATSSTTPTTSTSNEQSSTTPESSSTGSPALPGFGLLITGLSLFIVVQVINSRKRKY